MSVLKVARLGHPVLRKVAEPLTGAEIQSKETQELIDHMIETMHEYEGVGLAAPQIHISKQLAVLEVKNNSRYPDAPKVPLTVLINPRIASRSKKIVESWEGCLSVPDLRGIVPRNDSLVCEALDRYGKPAKLEVDGFFARVIQHEWDHLQGNVYLDRMTNLRSLSHLREFAQFWAKTEDED
ncbi:MAG: peptide deformylase [Candidatus Omnitrophica bacterium]|nr:peptide deformylase [Candidatus Omnitrophota bacterium]